MYYARAIQPYCPTTFAAGTFIELACPSSTWPSRRLTTIVLFPSPTRSHLRVYHQSDSFAVDRKATRRTFTGTTHSRPLILFWMMIRAIMRYTIMNGIEFWGFPNRTIGPTARSGFTQYKHCPS